jgi:hypothetical protein
MADKRALDFLEELIRFVKPPRGCAIVLTEYRNAPRNWMADADDTVSPDALARFVSAVSSLQLRRPFVDWDGVTERLGELRRIARFASEVPDHPTASLPLT